MFSKFRNVLFIIRQNTKKNRVNRNLLCNQRSSLVSDTTVITRRYTTEITGNLDEMITDYSYVKNAINNKNVFIIDVREPEEVKEHGAIPNSVNIPLGTISDVFSNMNNKDFEAMFKKQKPTENTEVICYCMIGKRSGMAQKNLCEKLFGKLDRLGKKDFDFTQVACVFEMKKVKCDE